MYYARKIPDPFRNRQEKANSIPPEKPVPIEAKEKIPETASPTKQCISPLAVLLLLDSFSKKKGDE